MINHTTLLANNGLALIMEQQKSISCEIDSIEPKRQELEVMKKKLIEQIDEKRHNLKLLKLYIDKLGSVRKIVFLCRILYNIYFRLMIGVYVGKIC
jgi:hypothetical protein